MQTFENFTDAYYGIINDVINKPDHISSPRNMLIKEKIGYQFCIKNPLDRLLYVPERESSISYAIAELIYYVSANNSTSWISNYSSFWGLISDDGMTANSAYGARIFVPHDRIASDIDPFWTQWNYVINELKSDPDSRRAVIHIRSPKDSILAQKDVPCTLTLQFLLRDDKVKLVTNMRSSDVILGITYDIPAFTFFQEMLAVRLSQELQRPIGVGDYIHVSNSLHVYSRHFEMAQAILDGALSNLRVESPMPHLPGHIPINELMLFETKCRMSKNKQELVNNVCDLITVDLETYFHDWCLILASHRAGKLKETNLQKALLSQTKFEGYKFFNK